MVYVRIHGVRVHIPVVCTHTQKQTQKRRTKKQSKIRKLTTYHAYNTNIEET